jgi:dTDP-4-dehydrorhamnose 3,5-epimerase
VVIEIAPGNIEGVRILRPTARCDRRGRLVKILQEDVFSKHGIPTAYAEQYYSVSQNNVLRGLHFQTPPHDHHKLVTCIEGDVFDVVVDLRRGSRSYGQHQSFELNGANGDTVFIPTGCAHGFYVRSKSATMLYNVTALYVASHDTGIRWDSAGISWPSAQPAVSDRDAALPELAEFDTPFVISAWMRRPPEKAVSRI